MKRWLLFLLSSLLVLVLCTPAGADNDKETMYNGYIDMLVQYINEYEGDTYTADGQVVKEDGLTRTERNIEYLSSLSMYMGQNVANYEYGGLLVYYVDALRYVESNNYSYALDSLDVLDDYPAFLDWLEGHDTLIGKDKLNHYVLARQAEYWADYFSAYSEYNQAMFTLDSVARKLEIRKTWVKPQYDRAMAEYRQGTSAGYREALKLIRPVAELDYMDSVEILMQLESLCATPTPKPTARPTATPTPKPTATPTPKPTPKPTAVPMPSTIRPVRYATQFTRGSKGQDGLYSDMAKMMDNNKNTAFGWIIWESEYTDSRPEFTFNFSNSTLCSVALRNGNVSSSGNYNKNARLQAFKLVIISNGRQYEEFIWLDDRYTTDYVEYEFVRAYENVTQVDMWYQDKYVGNGSTKYHCYISDIQFRGFE